MAIRQKELINKMHVLNKCVAFDYIIAPMDSNRKRIMVHFEMVHDGSEKVWRVSWNDLVDGGNRDLRYLGYSITYAMPMHNMALTMICAYGLRCLAGAFADTMQEMSAHEFVCYDVTKDM